MRFALPLPSAIPQKRQSLISGPSQFFSRRLPSIIIARAWQAREDLALVNFKRQALQRQADTGAPDACARRRFETRAMGGAHEVTVIRAEELIIDPIERDAGVRAAVDVGKVIAFIVDQQRFKVAPAAPHGELFARAMLELAHCADQFSHRFFLSRHGSFLSYSPMGLKSPSGQPTNTSPRSTRTGNRYNDSPLHGPAMHSPVANS